MKSALTSAMGSGAAAAPHPHIPADTREDLFAFPCLRDPSDQLGVDLQAAQEAAMEETLKFTPVGSAPTANPAAGLFDYEINPRNRRAAEEMATSLIVASSMQERQPLQSPKLGNSLQANVLASSLGTKFSQADQMEFRSSLGTTPTAALLSELPGHKLTGRTGEGKKLRRHVLRGAIIVFVTAGYSGKRFIYERAKELGVRSVILDTADSWCKELVREGIIEKFVDVDFSDSDVIFDKCLEAIRLVKNDLGDVDGICSFCELAIPLVARLCEVCGLPGNSSEAVDNARNKHATRRVQAEHGLPTPANFLIKEESQVEEASRLVGFPAVLKPIHGAASLGVIRVNNYDDLCSAYRRVAHELKTAKVVAGAIMEGDDEEESGNAGSWICLDTILEEYLDGPEVDCDLVFSEGKCVYGAISDNWPTIEPYFNETGSNCPSILPREQQKELLELSVRTVAALGFQHGVFHVEGKYTSRGARLIEVNCRMGGGPVRNINLLVWGVDLVEEQLLCTVGIPSRPPVAPKPLRCIAEFSINAQKTGTIKHTDYLSDWVDHDDVLYCRPLVKPGGKVVCVDDGMPTWVAEMMVEKPTVEEAIKLVKSMEEEIQKIIPIV